MTAGLNIAALARRTGIAPDTLRKWEQRYQILQPTRTAGGQRRYSERDVARVEWLRERLHEGYRIGEAATLLGTADVEPARSPVGHLRAILAAVDVGDLEQVGVRLDQAFALVNVDEMLSAVLCPLLQEIGDRWATGAMTVADEHLVSEAVRSRLGHLLADAGGGVHGVAVLTCAPGERHELGLMMAAIALRRDGWKIVYLGADTPFRDAAALAERVGARIVCVSVAAPARMTPLVRELERSGLPAGVSLVLGGAGANRTAAKRIGAVYAGPELAGAVRTVRALAA